MINKIVGYSAFRSYGELEYPSLKQGKDLQLANQIWSSTVRKADHVDPLQNYHHHQTAYTKNHLENTTPADYHPVHVPKGGNSSLAFGDASLTKLSKAFDKQEAEKSTSKNTYNLLQTGTEHWRTNYQTSICEPRFNQTLNTNSVSKPSSTLQQRHSSQAKNQYSLEQAGKANSYKNRAYVNNIKTGVSDYKFNFGEQIGANPLNLLSQSSNKQPLRNHPLKLGTNQLWTEIPGYQGHKPSEIPFNELESKIHQRPQKRKENLKVNLSQNYHVNVPGYAGFKPKSTFKDDQMRESCFTTKK